ncbi:MAG: hypothetical protein WCR42_11010, partial [bacterium]
MTVRYSISLQVLFCDRKNLLPLREKWRKILLQISGIVENFFLFFYNKLTKGRLFASCILHPASCILHPASC